MPHVAVVHTAPTRAVAQEIAQLAAVAQQADGIAPLSEQVLLAARGATERETAHVLLRDHLGEPQGPTAEADLVGYAQIDLSAPLPRAAELVVHPERRRRGLGSVLLAGLRGVMADGDLIDDDAARVAVWSHGDLPAARAFAAARGLERARELHVYGTELDADLDPWPPSAPEGFEVTTFDVQRDAAAWVELNALAFADHPEQGRMTLADLAARTQEGWFDPERLWLVRRPGEETLQAFLWVKQEPGGDVAELYVLAVHPQVQGHGLGSWLTELALADAARRGCRRLILYVDGENTAARAVYEKAGFTVDLTEAQYTG